MKKKVNLPKLFALSMVLIIAGAALLFFFIRGEKEKRTDGKLVSCTITSVSKIGKHRSAQGYYTDDNGNKIEVEVINTLLPAVGNVSEGYVVPDEPGKVYLKTPLWLSCLLICLAALFIGGGIALIISGINGNSNSKLLALEGQLAQGRVTNTRRDGSGNVVFYIAEVVYTDSCGTEHTFEDYSDRNKYRRVGDTVNVRYAQKKNGKYINEID